ncbi:MAG: transposase [Burkholderiaceae bacterium]
MRHAFNLSDEELVECWAENVEWQYLSEALCKQVNLLHL